MYYAFGQVAPDIDTGIKYIGQRIFWIILFVDWIL